MNTPHSFLGTGWSFPVTFTKNGQCTVETVSELADIEQSLTILFGTRPGERVLRFDYGCGLEDMLFEPANTSLLTFIKERIRNAVLFYEPRITLLAVDIQTDTLVEGRVEIQLDFTVRSTNSRYNYVYDYYTREASIQPVTQ